MLLLIDSNSFPQYNLYYGTTTKEKALSGAKWKKKRKN